MACLLSARWLSIAPEIFMPPLEPGGSKGRVPSSGSHRDATAHGGKPHFTCFITTTAITAQAETVRHPTPASSCTRGSFSEQPQAAASTTRAQSSAFDWRIHSSSQSVWYPAWREHTAMQTGRFLRKKQQEASRLF